MENDDIFPSVQWAKMADLGVQMSSMIHEIRQPLFAVKGLMQLQRGLEGSHDEAIYKQLERIESLIEHYSAMSQQSRPAEVYDLNLPVGSAVQFMAGRAGSFGVTLSAQLEEGRLPVLGCAVSVQQVAVNLLQNAYDAVSSGPGTGEVVVRTKGVGRFVRLEIEDTGGGLEDSVRESLFQPFVTSKPAGKGTGLGLYIVKQLVTAASGAIRLVDANQGLRVEVDLPLVA